MPSPEARRHVRTLGVLSPVLVVLLAPLATPTAHANPVLDIQFACPSTLDANERARIDRAQTTPLVFPRTFDCAIFYGNNSTAALEAEFTVTFPTREVTLWRDPPLLDTDNDTTNASELPDGVLRPFGFGRGHTWTSLFAQRVRPVSGFPAFDGNVFDRDNQQLRYTRQVQAGQTTSLQFETTENFHFTDYNSHFPSGNYEIALTAKIGGQQVMHNGAPARWVVPVEVGQGNIPQISMWPIVSALASNSRVRTDGRFTGYIAAGLATHVNAAAARVPVQTSAFVRVYLPYWNGTAFVADGAYDPLNTNHLPALDSAELAASLVRRPNAGYGTAGQVLEEVLVDAGANGPVTGANAGKLVRFDVATQTLYGTFGALGLNNNAYRAVLPVPSPGDEVLDRLGLRYSAPFNPAVLPFLTNNTIVPVSGCYESDQTGPAALPSATLCRTGRHIVGDEPWRDHTFLVNGLNAGGVVNENAPLGPGSTTQVWADCANLSGLPRDVDFHFQMPADATGRVAMDFTRAEIIANHAYGPRIAQRYEIHVSTRPADFGSPANMRLRTVPMASGADWVLCKAIDASAIPFGSVAATTISCSRNDLIAAGLTPEAIQEVRLRLIGQVPVALGSNDGNQGCGLGIVGTLKDDLPNSIDETCSGGPERYDAFALVNVAGTTGTASFGAVARTVSRYEDGRERAEFVGANAEYARRATVGACLGSGGSACYYTVSDTQIGRTERLYVSLANSGSAPMRAPFNFCGTLPDGFRPLNLANPAWNNRRLIAATGARVPASIRNVLMPASRYTLDFNEETRRVCISVPESPNADDPYNALLDELLVEFWGEIVPGASRTMRMISPTWSWREDTSCLVGAPRTVSAANGGGFNLGLTADVRLASITEPVEIGRNAGFCYRTSLENRAYNFMGQTVQNNAGSARDSVAWVRVPGTGHGVQTRFDRIESADARIWVTTAAMTTDMLRTATVLDANATDASVGFVPCAQFGATCDRAALMALGIEPESVTWAGAEIGELRVTDAAPRGQGPALGVAPVNMPYRIDFCLTDNGSADGATISSEIFFRSTDTANATDTTGAMRTTVNHDCPDGLGQAQEVCDGVDNDCDGLTDEDFASMPGWEELGEACADGDGVCRDEGALVCPDTNLPIGVDRDAPGACSTDGGGYTIAGTTAIAAGDLWRLSWTLNAPAGAATLQQFKVLIAPACVADSGWIVSSGRRLPTGVVRQSDGVSWTFGAFALPGTSAELVVLSRCRPDETLATRLRVTTNTGTVDTTCAFTWADPAAPDFVCDAQAGIPGIETCDGLDNDCNGVVDDAPGTGLPCTVGLGVCANIGRTVCPADGGSRFDCAGTPLDLAQPERCDSIDWNCNGNPLDGFDTVGNACSVARAECLADVGGTWQCRPDGTAAECVVPETVLADSDNDGAIDGCDCAPGDARFAGLTPALDAPCDADGDGHCAAGIDTAHVGLNAFACPPSLHPDGTGNDCNDADRTISPSAPERCDQVDRDCDGVYTNGFAVGEACTVVRNTCVLEGTLVCARGGGGTSCDTAGEICPVADCEVAGGQPCRVGVGACARNGVTICDAALGAVTCSAVPGEPALVDDCSGRDIDCDGIVDNAPEDCACDGFAGNDDVCPGAWTPDQRDTNGDGIGDACDCNSNGVTRCRAWHDGCVVEGRLNCENAVRAGGCEPVPEALDVHGGVLNDWCTPALCGPVDPGVCAAFEGEPCVVGLGICARDGFTRCADDRVGVVCDAEPGPPEAEERCDGRDNDCDGLVDNAPDGGCDLPEPQPEPGPEAPAEHVAEADEGFLVEGGGCGGGDAGALGWLSVLAMWLLARRRAAKYRG